MSILAQPTPETTATLIDFPPPTWLKHTPIYMLPYRPFDGHYAPDTDAIYLSFGLPQWRYESDGDEFALSIKSWRKPHERWSRESEELPIHRNVDMTILLAHVLFRTEPSQDVEIPAHTFENQDTPIILKALRELPEESAGHQERCRARLCALRDMLNRLAPPAISQPEAK